MMSTLRELPAAKGGRPIDMAGALGTTVNSLHSFFREETRNRRAERAIADMLGLPLDEVFPDFYDEHGMETTRRRSFPRDAEADDDVERGRPGNKAYQKAYQQRPEVKARRKIYMAAYWQRTQVKA